MNNAIQLNDSATKMYADEGFICPIDLLPTEKLHYFRDQFNALETREGKDKTVINLLGRHMDERFIWELATLPRVLDWVEAVMGPNLLLLSTHFFCKYPGKEDGHFVAWHQDVTYWGLEPAKALTAWIAIDDSNRENGCMEVIPRSHLNGIMRHGKADQANNLLASNQEIDSAELDLQSAQPFELRAGQMSLHDGALAHASQPNLSNQRRCGMTARFITPDVRQVKPSNNKNSSWKPIVVRGEDPHRHFPLTAAPF